MTDTRNSFVWYELMTSDVASAKTFYAKVVGWTTQEMPTPGVGRFAMVTDPLGAAFNLFKPNQPGERLL